jgi:hypothetical protein
MVFSRARGGAASGGLKARRTVQDELRDLERVPTRSETPSQRTDRLVRELIARTTQSKDR